MSSEANLNSSETNLSQNVSEDATPKSSSASDRAPSIKKEVSKSPTPEPKPKSSQARKNSSSRTAAGLTGEDGTETVGQQQSLGRKKRARATPSEDVETNGRKSATDSSGRESSLWSSGEGEGPVQGSLLEEVLAEKRMALMRSPQVIQFLQQRQMTVQQHSLLHPPHPHPHSTTTPHFCVSELEEDANS